MASYAGVGKTGGFIYSGVSVLYTAHVWDEPYSPALPGLRWTLLGFVMVSQKGLILVQLSFKSQEENKGTFNCEPIIILIVSCSLYLLNID